MIFADKLILLRKKSGWSQEELAEQMNVTRQSVSKWEGAQSIPDLEKIIKLSKMFGVSIDYLLKEELEEPESIEPTDDPFSLPKISMEDAHTFLRLTQETARPIACGVSLCILSPVCLLLLLSISESSGYPITQHFANGIGCIILLIFIAVAVSIFILNSGKTKKFEYLQQEIFDTEYGVFGMVTERMEQYHNTYVKRNIIGVFLCIISSIPILAIALFQKPTDLFTYSMVSLNLGIISIAVNILVQNGIIWSGFEKLLQKGEFSKEKKRFFHLKEIVSSIYWLIIVALYLGYSFCTNLWGQSWVIWPVAGVLFPAVLTLFCVFSKKKSQ